MENLVKDLVPIDYDEDNKLDVERVRTRAGTLLTLRQMEFIRQMFNPAHMFDSKKAAEASGYKNPSSASTRLMSNVAVRSELERRSALLQVDTTLTAEAVLNKLWDECNNHEQDDSSPMARVSGLKVLAQHFELIGKKDVGTNQMAVQVNINIGGDKKTVTIDGTSREVKEDE